MFSDGEQQISPTRSVCILIVICLVCLVPFVNKAFHIDDPTFIAIARHLQSDPSDYFGYYMRFSPPVITNPPLVSYYIAIAGFCFGYSEASIHAAFLAPACAVLIGAYLLARDLCPQPLLAAVATLCTPVFLLSGTTVMCDMLMVAFWVFSVYFWRRGITQPHTGYLLIASTLAVFCILTKYSGICLIPLLLAYSLFEKRSVGTWLFYLLLPIAVLLVFDHATYVKYGLRQIKYIESWSFYNHTTTPGTTAANIVTGVSFLGGCILVHCGYFLTSTRRYVLFLYVAAVVSLLLMAIAGNLLLEYPITTANGINWIFLVQLTFFVFAGASFIGITGNDLIRNRDSDSLLLFLWVTGTLAFTIFVNWSVNGRSILPIAPVAGIIVMRRLTRSYPSFALDRYRLYGPPALSLLIAMLVTHADYRLANTARTAAQTIHAAIKNDPGNVWFEGEWGFRYYMERAGNGKQLDYKTPLLAKGDIIIVPSNNCNTKPLFKHMATFDHEFVFDDATLFSTINIAAGAGFYSSVFGPLPFAVGYAPDKYYLYGMIVDKDTRFSY